MKYIGIIYILYHIYIIFPMDFKKYIFQSKYLSQNITDLTFSKINTPKLKESHTYDKNSK